MRSTVLTPEGRKRRREWLAEHSTTTATPVCAGGFGASGKLPIAKRPDETGAVTTGAVGAIKEHLFVRRHLKAMPLPTGHWTLMNDGIRGDLWIQSVDISGNLAGTWSLLGGDSYTILGYWDEVAQKLLFFAHNSVYTGFLFQDGSRMPGLTGSIVFTLVGYFINSSASPGISASPDRHSFGWLAQIGQD